MKLFVLFVTIAIGGIAGQGMMPSDFSSSDMVFPGSLGDFQKNQTLQQNMVHEPIADSTYIVGPGDEFRIVMWGNVQENDLKVSVDPEGNLLLPKIGIVPTQKDLRTLKKDVVALIRSKTKYTDVIIELSQVKSVIITVSGEVDKPGSYTFRSTVRLNDVLSQAFSKTIDILNYKSSSFRNIIVNTPDGASQSYDFENFLNNGVVQDNPYLFSGYRVVVPPRIQLVTISGSIVRYGSPDYRRESLFDFIRFCGGLRPDADSSNMRVTSYSADGMKLQSQTLTYPEECKAYQMQPADAIVVGGIPYWQEQITVTLAGRVRNPGQYLVEKGTSIAKCIEMAGGILEDGDVNIAYIRRDRFTNLSLEVDKGYKAELTDWFLMNAKKINADFNNVFFKTSGEYALAAVHQDVVYIPWKTNDVSVIGCVANPGLVKFKEGKQYPYYINTAGGFSNEAFKSHIRIYRASKGAWVAGEKTGGINAGDIIFAPEMPPNYAWNRFKDVLTLTTGVLTTAVLFYSTLRN
ncbi:MAG: hypothetical protein A2268_08940 [Candidatus Raymondbacteria bacterium RifOxyA12_full_50_37]|uniref:Soluble ligand binding domain-containing protein n=1 Tax=Candidatus Raymondbacteria bacterium RIFOXYD12_FULL_49_13 TaxID=1817890 RepID=A0A1F7FG57_UNCRA|nr:MAG: hypothetical protein A2350_19860 [Candidatus Raymondbacteria bacterium RifOxyB12_full_50_8]OGJ91618.1 MAG: hypothetical protein A2268_08940 [Candidatus Raymondbacteria bacterium RifOxyA12_full_50_37]OGJ92924.1 MAG: hypothetical protein A2248_08640 [Candidatus Raymondbacteria bacterium RIFOXYA2_FULL_49_16]OGJ94850.1 MAG: hypothetical protein A2487_03345 [Candidatus Raymondbacteria bacterium RifOxyC12_full_50_8]OGK05690.1 MAG: hypothetical protein A2519_03830 [Candidatus Raymondbacteria b